MRARVVALLSVLVLLSTGGVSSEASPQTLPRLQVDGGQIVDELDRTVLLRGVNVNQLVEYWQGTDFPTVFPLPSSDFDLIASFGWNAVRLLVSWSRIEPSPGEYDEAYLQEVAQAARWAGERGIYVILDLHQDAWGPHLAARPDEVCPPGSVHAIGWDGAPQWATFDDGLPRCYVNNREINWAVAQAFQSFWLDRPGPDGVGIQTRYHAMLRHLSRTFTDPWIAGIDIMNEPNPGYLIGANDATLLRLFYARAVEAIRAGERDVGAAPHIVFFEPAITWGLAPVPVGRFTLDPNVVFAPHVYGESIGPLPPEHEFDAAARESRLYGDVPVLIGEWGADPRRAGPGGDGYLVRILDLQDVQMFSGTMWTWRESCGDPHKAEQVRAGDGANAIVWGLFDVDCRTNEIQGMRDNVRHDVLRAYPRAASGTLAATAYDHHTGIFRASGTAAFGSGATEIVYPAAKHGIDAPESLEVHASGLTDIQVTSGPHAELLVVTAQPTGGPWSISAGG